MSVLIKGMGMPRDCGECRFGYDGKCFAVSPIHRFFVGDTFECPLIEIPPHGRLIDADALMDGWMHLRDAIKYGNKNAEQQRHSYSTMMMYEIANEIDDAPTIIEAEE